MQTIFVAFRSCSPRSMTNSETAELQKLKAAHVAGVGPLGNRESNFKEKKKNLISPQKSLLPREGETVLSGAGVALGSLGETHKRMTCNVTLGGKWVFGSAWPPPTLLTTATGSCWTGRCTISGRTCHEARCSARQPPAHSHLLGPHRGQLQGTGQGQDSPDCLTGSQDHPPRGG